MKLFQMAKLFELSACLYRADPRSCPSERVTRLAWPPRFRGGVTLRPLRYAPKRQGSAVRSVVLHIVSISPSAGGAKAAINLDPPDTTCSVPARDPRGIGVVPEPKEADDHR